MNISRKQKLVLKAIELQPGAADDDALLLATVWKLEGWNDNRNLYDNLRRVSRSETICRRRRELFNMGLIQYSSNAHKRRSEAFKSERQLHTNFTEAILKGV